MIYKINYREQMFIRYLIVGGATSAVGFLTYFACTRTILVPDKTSSLQIANIISWVTAVTFAYFSNRKYVFNCRNDAILYEALRFYISRISTLLIDMMLMYCGVILLHLNDILLKFLVQVIIVALNYIFSSFFVFKNRTHNSNKVM